MPALADKIKHIVVLMMENRSFDHMLGFLKSPTYPINGLDGTESNPDLNGVSVKVTPDARFSGDLTPDAGHHFEDVNVQLFGAHPAPTGATPTMQGFIKNFAKFNKKNASRIMRCFAPTKLTVLSKLAQQYAVCDKWFSSVPGPTFPNRAYLHFGTSFGRLDMAPNYDGPSIYQALDKVGVSTKVYFHDSTLAQSISFLNQNQKKFFGEFNDFLKDCKKGTLPAYCLVEPMFNSDADFAANDQHPDHDVAEGEVLIRDVYNAIRGNQALWESTMFIIVYDEHGGTYDHVVPDPAVNPDGQNCADPAFDFKRYGVRVPAVVISAYTQPGTILNSRFDHTSVIATARKLLTNNTVPPLSLRDQQANTLEGCLNQSTPRTDAVTFAAPRALLTRGPVKRTRRAIGDCPPSDFQLALLEQALMLEAQFPPRQRSGRTLKSFKTEKDAAQFLRAVKKKLLAGAIQPAGQDKPDKPAAAKPKKAPAAKQAVPSASKKSAKKAAKKSATKAVKSSTGRKNK